MKVLPPPGPQRTRQLALLAVVLIALAFVGWRYFGPASSAPTAVAPPSASNTQAKAAQASAPAPAGPAMPQPVRLDRLEPVPEAPQASRNPFRFGVPPPPPRVERPPVVIPPAPPPGPTGPPPPPPIALNFIGRIVRNDGKVIATLKDGRGTIFEVTDGQIVDGKYRVVTIGQESLIIEYVNGVGRQTLRLQ